MLITWWPKSLLESPPMSSTGHCLPDASSPGQRLRSQESVPSAKPLLYRPHCCKIELSHGVIWFLTCPHVTWREAGQTSPLEDSFEVPEKLPGRVHVPLIGSFWHCITPAVAKHFGDKLWHRLRNGLALNLELGHEYAQHCPTFKSSVHRGILALFNVDIHNTTVAWSVTTQLVHC